MIIKLDGEASYLNQMMKMMNKKNDYFYYLIYIFILNGASK
jgi:hypothetical protein